MLTYAVLQSFHSNKHARPNMPKKKKDGKGAKTKKGSPDEDKPAIPPEKKEYSPPAPSDREVSLKIE